MPNSAGLATQEEDEAGPTTLKLCLNTALQKMSYSSYISPLHTHTLIKNRGHPS